MNDFVKLPRGAIAHLRRVDPALAEVIARVGPCRLEKQRHGPALAALVRSIVFQQLSGKAASTIFGRFRALFRGSRFPSARAILAASDDDLRTAGLSRAKVAAVRDLCAKVTTRALRLSDLEHCTDDDIIARLIPVRGIGVWSAQMFLMFHLGRLDVWPPDDLGIRKALARLHNSSDLPDRKEAETMGDRYRPYRTLAAWYLWRSLDGEAML